MKTDLYNQEGKVIDSVNLLKDIFEVEMNNDLVHQVLVSQQANRRQKSAKTKDRAEVRGGGKKPWRQKGTGRARHGSIRSPLWKGGGVTFGPETAKILKREIPKKMRRKALFMVLSSKAEQGNIIVIDEIKLQAVKTKEMVSILKNFIKQGTGLIVVPENNKDILRASQNIPKVFVIEAKNLNVLDLLNIKNLLLLKDSLKVIKETFLK